MSVLEQPLTFACSSETLVGVLSRPPAGLPESRIGVVVVVGGPQYRAGSHRQFVQLARRIAEAGHVALRFDVRGMGDSTGAQQSFDRLDDDIAAAIAVLRRNAPETTRIVLWGLCDGASAALMFCTRRGSAGIDGLCLANPWLRSPESLAQTQVKHYYRQRILQPAFWSKLLRGGVAAKALRDLVANLRLATRSASLNTTPTEEADFRASMARGWQSFQGAMLLLTSGNDITAREFLEASRTLAEWKGAFTKSGLVTLHFADADHTFSSAPSRLLMEAGVLQWLHALRDEPPHHFG